MILRRLISGQQVHGLSQAEGAGRCDVRPVILFWARCGVVSGNRCRSVLSIWATVYLFFSTICHQIARPVLAHPGEQLGLCIRCTSISLGFLAGCLLLRTPNVRWLKIAIAITAVRMASRASRFMDSELLSALSGFAAGCKRRPDCS